MFEEIIKSIPYIFQYYTPGLLTLFIYNHFRPLKISISYHAVACAISYLLISIINLFFKIQSPVINCISATILGTILSLCSIYIMQSKYFNSFTTKIFYQTMNDDVLTDCVDYKNGSNLIIKLREENFCIHGHYRLHDKKEIKLSAYMKIDLLNGEQIVNYENDDTKVIVVNRSDIEYLECR